MTAIKAYILRLILCGVLVSLAGSLAKGKILRRALTLCGGCLMILTALEPLAQVDLTRLPELGLGLGLSQAERQQAALEKNEALLRELVERQTAEWVQARGAEMGLSLRVRVRAEKTPEGLCVPVALTLAGTQDPALRQAMEALLYPALDLPPGAIEWEDA